MTGHPLSSALLAACGRSADETSLERTLTALIEAARAAHPNLEVEPVAFAAFLGERIAVDEEPLAAVAALNVSDLYLAHACANRSDGAAERLEALHIRGLDRALARIDKTAAFVSEVAQQLREKLLVGGPSGGAKIASYRGRGPLSAWIRVAAIRTALNLKDAAKNHQASDDDNPPAPLIDGDLELEMLRARHAGDFRSALGEAITGLPSRERAALRLRFIDGLSIDQIGRIYDVHRATVARWIASARETVRDKTSAILRERLGLSESEAESLVRDIKDKNALTTGMLDSEVAGDPSDD